MTSIHDLIQFNPVLLLIKTQKNTKKNTKNKMEAEIEIKI